MPGAAPATARTSGGAIVTAFRATPPPLTVPRPEPPGRPGVDTRPGVREPVPVAIPTLRPEGSLAFVPLGANWTPRRICPASTRPALPEKASRRLPLAGARTPRPRPVDWRSLGGSETEGVASKVIVGNGGSNAPAPGERGLGMACTSTSHTVASIEAMRYETNSGRSSWDASSKRNVVSKLERSDRDTGHLAG